MVPELLPQAWIDYWTQGRKLDSSEKLKDRESTLSEILAWANKTLPGYDEDLCPRMREKVDGHRKLTKEEASSYDKLINAHMNVTYLAAEGHVGCDKALKEISDIYKEVCTERVKREGEEEIDGEIFRSFSGALRKVKHEVDAGTRPLLTRCDQFGGLCNDNRKSVGPPTSSGPDLSRNKLKDCGEYELNDDGNAEHFNDWFTDGDDPLQHWVEGYGWIVWEKNKDYDFFQWKLDKGNKVMRQRWWDIKKRQEDYAFNLRVDYAAKLKDQLDNVGNPGYAASITGARAMVEKDRKLRDDWESFSRSSGNNRQFNEMLTALTHRTGIRKLFSELDNKPHLMGVANGVIELSDTVTLRDPKPSDYITLNTNIPYEKPSQLAIDTWQNYLDTFLPDKSLQRTAQIALGHCLYGKNEEKIMLVLKGKTNTGKSTMVNAVAAALGDYATSVGVGIFQEKNFNEDVCNAYGKRFVYHSESGDKSQYSPSMIKRLSAGMDPLVTNIKNSMEQLRYQPSFVLILMTNETPNIPGADEALLGRLYVIPFDTMPEHIDKKSGDVVKIICGVAIQNWLLDGHMQYRTIKELPRTQAVIEQTKQFFSELDDFTNFVSDGLIEHHNMKENVDWSMQPEWRVKRQDMYEHFKSWWRSIGRVEHDRPSAIAVTKRLGALGIPGTHGNDTVTHGGESARWWYGVKLRPIKDSGSNVYRMKPRD